MQKSLSASLKFFFNRGGFKVLSFCMIPDSLPQINTLACMRVEYDTNLLKSECSLW